MADNHYDLLLGQISKLGHLDREDVENIKKYFHYIQAPRNTILEEADRIPNFVFCF